MIFDDNLYAAPAYTFTEQEAGCKSSEKGCTVKPVQPERMGKGKIWTIKTQKQK